MPFHLLIVDDEAHSRKLLRMVLRQGDYVFLEAESGEEALQIMGQQGVDLLLLDLMMPHQNGFDVILAMRKYETQARIPFIVASASTAQDDIQRSLELGAIDYFTKPLSECDIRFQIPLKVRNAIALHQASDERLRIERMKAVSAMAVALNHEINNPLQVIQGNAQLIHSHPGLPQPARPNEGRIRRAGQPGARLT